jgi:hypothetical protein
MLEIFSHKKEVTKFNSKVIRKQVKIRSKETATAYLLLKNDKDVTIKVACLQNVFNYYEKGDCIEVIQINTLDKNNNVLKTKYDIDKPFNEKVALFKELVKKKWTIYIDNVEMDVSYSKLLDTYFTYINGERIGEYQYNSLKGIDFNLYNYTVDIDKESKSIHLYKRVS